jgi:hypothetical protein
MVVTDSNTHLPGYLFYYRLVQAPADLGGTTSHPGCTHPHTEQIVCPGCSGCMGGHLFLPIELP